MPSPTAPPTEWASHLIEALGRLKARDPRIPTSLGRALRSVVGRPVDTSLGILTLKPSIKDGKTSYRIEKLTPARADDAESLAVGLNRQVGLMPTFFSSLTFSIFLNFEIAQTDQKVGFMSTWLDRRRLTRAMIDINSQSVIRWKSSFPWRSNVSTLASTFDGA